MAFAVLATVVAGCGGSGRGEVTATTTPGATDAPSTALVPFEVPDGVVPIDYPDQLDSVPWPTEEWPEAPLPDGADAAAVTATLDAEFGEMTTDELHAFDAVVVVHRGAIVAERYRPEWGDAETPHRSWSMAKSVTQALVGVLVGRGELDVFAPAPVPEWVDPTDPRHEITVDQMLRMATGLAWKEEYYAPDSDTVAMLNGVGAPDMAHYAADKPLEVEPGTRVRYSTGTSNIVAGVIGRTVGTGDATERFVEESLLDPLGIDVADTRIGWDGAGQLVGGSIFDLTPRDFAKFGLLYARGGVWDGQQVVPEGWVDYARTPTPPPAGTPEYGAHWWTYDECEGGFRAGGFNGQHIVVCPALDLVVVVLGNRVDGRDGEVRDDLVAAFRGVEPAT